MNDTLQDLLRRARPLLASLPHTLAWEREQEGWLRDYEAAMRHQHRYDTLRIYDNRIYTVCLECGDLKYEGAEAVTTDTERLDWMFANGAFVIKEDNERGWFIAYVEREPAEGFYKTPREAIDAAMRGGTQPASADSNTPVPSTANEKGASKMRIIHDVNCPMQVSAHRNGGRGGLFACTDCSQNHPKLPRELFEGESELIEIEGDPKYIRKMLEDWLEALTCMENVIQKEGEPSTANEKGETK